MLSYLPETVKQVTGIYVEDPLEFLVRVTFFVLFRVH
jgi:hypothetical protein